MDWGFLNKFENAVKNDLNIINPYFAVHDKHGSNDAKIAGTSA